MQHPSRHRGLRRRAARAGRRQNLLAAFGLALAPLLAGAAGCAVYDGQWEGGCLFDCGPQTPAGACTAPSDCGDNETCGGDGFCHPGNCTYWGCVDGYGCALTEDATAECVLGGGTTASTSDGAGGSGGGASGDGGAGGAGGATTVSGVGGGVTTYCGSPRDCDADSTCGEDGACHPGTCEDVPCIFGFVCDAGTCVRQNAAGCGSDADCVEGRCVSGVCTASADLCFDGVQCAPGSACADGRCVPSCAAGAPCPDAYLCDPARDTCSLPAVPCSTTSDCDGSTSVCVDGACVARAVPPTPDDPPACDDGDVWVDNGCIPDQAATFACTEEGTQSRCANGLVCVHRTCFVPCEAPNEGACASIPGIENCKSVPAETGTYAVCGADDHLGGECDLSREIACAGELVCVDGTCR